MCPSFLTTIYKRYARGKLCIFSLFDLFNLIDFIFYFFNPYLNITNTKNDNLFGAII